MRVTQIKKEDPEAAGDKLALITEITDYLRVQ